MADAADILTQVIDRLTRQLDAERAARHHAERAADHKARLQAMTAALSRELRAADVAEVLVDQTRAALGASAVWVSEVSADGVFLDLLCGKGFTDRLAADYRRFPLMAPVPASEVVRLARPLWFTCRDEVFDRYPILRAHADHVVEASIGLPLSTSGRCIGMVGLSFTEIRDFPQDERDFLQALADQAAMAIERARLYEAELQARTRAEELAVENARLYKEARQASDRRDEFLSVAAHELKTPLTILRGHAELLLLYLDKPAGVDPRHLRHGLTVIGKQSDKLTHLLTELLDVSRIDAGKLMLNRKQVCLSDLLLEVVENLRASGAACAITLAQGPRIEGSFDAIRLEQVMVNLLDNAIKYSPAGEAIEVELLKIDEDRVRLTVTDQGIGIPPERRGRLFDRFYQAHPDNYTSGMGLGLYISRQIVVQHGGELTAEFPQKGGTRFVVTLPTAEGGSEDRT